MIYQVQESISKHVIQPSCYIYAIIDLGLTLEKAIKQAKRSEGKEQCFPDLQGNESPKFLGKGRILLNFSSFYQLTPLFFQIGGQWVLPRISGGGGNTLIPPPFQSLQTCELGLLCPDMVHSEVSS